MLEEELADIVRETFEVGGHVLHAEVGIVLDGHPRTVDLVAIKGKELIAIECKRALNESAFGQAAALRSHAACLHYRNWIVHRHCSRPPVDDLEVDANLRSTGGSEGVLADAVEKTGDLIGAPDPRQVTGTLLDDEERNRAPFRD